MNSLDRFKKTFAFEKTDRLPIFTLGGWEETYRRWKKEGLPDHWRETNFFGEDTYGETGVHLGTNGFSPFFPRLKKKILDETINYQVFIDEHGKTVKQKKGEVDVTISEYLEFPVKNRNDWERFRYRMNPDVDIRYVELDKRAKIHGEENREYPVVQPISGTYRLMWHLFGDVQMCYTLYDDPELVHDIMKQWLAMNITAIDRIMNKIKINVLIIMEDMSCNTGMMISPDMFRRFMMPYYKELIRHVGKYPSLFGILVDSDGDVTELVPLLMECGINGMFPFEVQAGMDVVRIREIYGEKLVIRGGIDKRALVKDKAAIDRELERVLPTFVNTNGYFVCLDHQAPPDISLENYIYCIEQCKKYK